MKLFDIFRDLARKDHRPKFGALEILNYIGPGLLVTVGFIDPGNWASNLAAGSTYGYALLWVLTLSTVMLVLLQHNAAHLGIATGLCLSEATTLHMPCWASRPLLGSALLASVSTSLAELLGAALALRMLFGLPLLLGACLAAAIVLFMLWGNHYRRLEKWIIGFVSLIGLSFLFELSLVKIDWPAAVRGWTVPQIPEGSILVVMSVLGAVVMPHNLFLHSEIIQSRQWQHEDEAKIKRQLDYEFLDTLLSMGAGWAINSAILLLAVAAFHVSGTQVGDLEQAGVLLKPLLGPAAATIFALALLCSGVASTLTSGMAAGSICAGMFGEPYDLKDSHSRLGVGLSIGLALLAITFVADPLKALIVSQALLSMQLPFTIFPLIWLTSSKKVMGKHANSLANAVLLYSIGGAIVWLNALLLKSLLLG